MNTSTVPTIHAVEPTLGSNRSTHPSPRRAHRLARTAGWLYLVIFVCGLFSEVVVRSSIVEVGDAAATVDNLIASAGLFRFGFVTDLVMVAADVATAVLIYLLLAPVSRAVALTATAFRLVQSAVLGANLLHHLMAIQLLDGEALLGGFTSDQRAGLVLQSLEHHRFGYFIALVFFAVHLALLGWLIARSTYLPRALGVLLGAAAIGYLFDSLSFFLVPGYEGGLSPIALAPALVAELSLIVWLVVRGVDRERWEERV